MENASQQVYVSLGRRTFWIFVIQRAGLAPLFFILAAVVPVLMSYGNIAQFEYISNWLALGFSIFGILILVIGIIIGLLQYSVSKVMLDDSSFHIVRGILSKEETVIPYRRIQGVEIKQSLFYRIVGVGHISIATTTDLEQPNQTENEANEEVISTIDYSLAKIIEKTLIDRAEIERVENVAIK
jgi:uncharacterized membrane protein YdbT with pleckstrin-like domain